MIIFEVNIYDESRALLNNPGAPAIFNDAHSQQHSHTQNIDDEYMDEQDEIEYKYLKKNHFIIYENIKITAPSRGDTIYRLNNVYPNVCNSAYLYNII